MYFIKYSPHQIRVRSILTDMNEMYSLPIFHAISRFKKTDEVRRDPNVKQSSNICQRITHPIPDFIEVHSVVVTETKNADRQLPYTASHNTLIVGLYFLKRMQ